MQLDPQKIGAEAMYKLMIGCVVPRPIAWVSSVDADNVVDDALAEQMNRTSGDYAPEIDEFELAGLATAPSARVKAPRVAGAPINMECRVVQIIPIGNGPSNLVIGQIVQLHFRDDVYDPTTGRLDMHRLRPVGRLAGQLYTHVHDIFEMKRPAADYRG